MRKILAGALVAAVLTGLTSCGDDDDGAVDNGTAPTEDAADVEGDGDDEVSDDGDAVAADGIDPCSLLTDAEVEQVAGGPPDGEPDVTEQHAVGMLLCTWTVTLDESTGDQRFVQAALHETSRLSQDQQDGGLTAKAVMEQNLADSDSEEVEGLGHDAWFSSLFGMYVLLDEDLVLNVSASALFGGADEDEEREATRTATELALANLEAQLG